MFIRWWMLFLSTFLTHSIAAQNRCEVPGQSLASFSQRLLIKSECARQMEEHWCELLRDTAPDEIRDCTEDESSLITDFAYSQLQCNFQTWIKPVLEIPQWLAKGGLIQALQPDLSTQKFDFNRRQFLNRCQKSDDCLSSLYKAAHGSAPSRQELATLRTAWHHKLDYLWQKSVLRNGPLSSPTDPWMRAQIAQIRNNSGLPTPEKPVSLSEIKELIQAEFDRYPCLKRSSQMELACYAAILAVAPTAAAGRNFLGQLPRFRKLAELAALRPNAELAIKAERALGRKLSQEQKIALEKSHRVGEDAAGADGSPARLGNYTQGQKNQKMLILRRGGFTDAEAQRLGDLGIAGKATRDLTDPDNIDRALLRLESEEKVARSYAEADADAAKAAAQREELWLTISECRQQHPLPEACLRALEAVAGLEPYTPPQVQPRKIQPSSTVQNDQAKTSTALDEVLKQKKTIEPEVVYNYTTLDGKSYSIEFTHRALKEVDKDGSARHLSLLHGLMRSQNSASTGIKLLPEMGKGVIEIKSVGHGHKRFFGCLDGNRIIIKKFIDIQPNRAAYTRAIDSRFCD